MTCPARRLPPLLLAAALSACGGPHPIEPAAADADGGDFSGPRAWSDLQGLTALGARPLGSEAAESARRYIATNLEQAGISVETVTTTVDTDALGPLTLTHLVARLPGESSDRLVLIAPYDSGQYDGFAFVGANDGASGAAVLLELARVFAGRERPYTIELVWLQGEGRLGRGEEKERERRWLGSQSLAARWAEEGKLDHIRLLAEFNRVCDADLHITRDLGSHRVHRDEFWSTARRLGEVDAFPIGGGFESVVSSHVAFRKRGVRPVVAIEDTVFGGDEPPGLYAGNEGDVLAHCAPESLATVGGVATEAVEKIAARLAKIDRFAAAPSAAPEPEATPEPPRGGEENVAEPSAGGDEPPSAEGKDAGNPT